MSYLRYCIVGKDTVFSFAPVDLGDDKFILCDGLYDLADSPYCEEFCRIAMPQVFSEFTANNWGEYWNEKTGLLVEYQPGEEGYSPDPIKPAPLAGKSNSRPDDLPLVQSCAGGGFNLERVIKFVGFNRPALLVTDCELYWSANTLNDILTFDDDQHRIFKLVEVGLTEAHEFFEV